MMAKAMMPAKFRAKRRPQGHRVPADGSVKWLTSSKAVNIDTAKPMKAPTTPSTHRRMPQPHRAAAARSRLSRRTWAT
jgi:hypothetical protein